MLREYLFIVAYVAQIKNFRKVSNFVDNLECLTKHPFRARFPRLKIFISMHFDTGPTSQKTGQISPLVGPIFTPQHCVSVQSFPLETPGSDSLFLNNLYNQEHNFVTMAIVELRFLGLFYSQYSSQVGKGVGKILQDHTTKAVKTSCYLTGSESTGDGYITPEHRRKHYQAEAKPCSGLGRMLWVHVPSEGIK